MNPFNMVLFAAVAASAAALPQYGNSGGGQTQKQRNCNWRTEVVYDETVRQECSTKYQRKCSTLYKKVCNPYEDEVCETYQRRQCDQKYRTKYRNWTEKDCKPKYETRCKEQWETDSYGTKHWVKTDDCDEYENGEDCRDVAKQEEYKEPYEDCYNVPDKKCRYVTKQDCKQQPYEDCKRVPYKDCNDVHEKKPRQVRRQYCDGKLVSGGNNNGHVQKGNNSGDRNSDVHDYDYDYEQNGSYSAQDVSDAFDVRNNDGNIGTKEVGTRSEGGDDASDDEGKDDSAIHFGR